MRNVRDRVHEAVQNLNRFIDGEITREELECRNAELLDARFIQEQLFTDRATSAPPALKQTTPGGQG